VRKTAKLFLEQIEEVIKMLEVDWEVKVIAFTSDASGEARKARSLLRAKRPEIITLDCYCHQVCLLYAPL
jgi:hypothetical protein